MPGLSPGFLPKRKKEESLTEDTREKLSELRKDVEKDDHDQVFQSLLWDMYLNPRFRSENAASGGGWGGGGFTPPKFQASDDPDFNPAERKKARLEAISRLNRLLTDNRNPVPENGEHEWLGLFRLDPDGLSAFSKELRRIAVDAVENFIKLLGSDDEIRIYDTVLSLLSRGNWEKGYIDKLRIFVDEIEKLFSGLLGLDLGDINREMKRIPTFVRILPSKVRVTEILEIYSCSRLMVESLKEGNPIDLSMDYDGNKDSKEGYFLRSFSVRGKEIFGLRKLGNRYFDGCEVDLVIFDTGNTKVSIIDSKLKVFMKNPKMDYICQLYGYFYSLHHLVFHPDFRNSDDEHDMLRYLGNKINSLKFLDTGRTSILKSSAIDKKIFASCRSNIPKEVKLLLAVMNLKGFQQNGSAPVLLGQKDNVLSYNFMSESLTWADIF